MAKKSKNNSVEFIPDGMSKKDYADAAFKKRVTIINSCILLAFVIGVIAVIFFGWYNNQQEMARFDELQAAYTAERDRVKADIAEIKAAGGSYEDRSKVKIVVTDDTYSNWIYDLDSSYQGDRERDDYACFGGAQITLQGMFVTKEFSNSVQYWVYRKHHHEEHAGEHSHTGEDGATGEEIPIEVIFDGDIDVPEDGTWVEIKGIVGPDSTKNLSAIRYAEMKILDEPGTEYVE